MVSIIKRTSITSGTRPEACKIIIDLGKIDMLNKKEDYDEKEN
jgi:hypothetical protein